MNPNIIFIGNRAKFLHDPRWQALRAVQNKRVYGGGSGFRVGLPTWNLDARPLSARLEAEIVHPDRLQPKIRQLARDHFIKAYGYRLNDEELDEMLGVVQQKDAPGYARIVKNHAVVRSSADQRVKEP